MSENNKANPTTILLMLVGIVVCIAFIIHGLSAVNAPHIATAPTHMATENTTAVATPGTAVSAPGHESRPPRNGAAIYSEADLARNADPFMPIGGWKASPESGAAPVHPPTGPQQTASLLPARVTLQPPFPGTLTGVNTKEPELVGTLLGERPCAVFRIDQQILTASQGGQLMGWKVVSIRQGAALLQGMGRTLRLTTAKAGLSIGSAKTPTSLNSVPISQAKPIASTLPMPRSEPEASVVGHITVTDVAVRSDMTDASTLPDRSDTYRSTLDDTDDATRLAVSGPFVQPAPQLSGIEKTDDGRDLVGTDPGVISPRRFSVDQTQTTAERNADIIEAQFQTNLTPGKAAGLGRQPRHHRRHKRRHLRVRRHPVKRRFSLAPHRGRHARIHDHGTVSA